MIYVTVIFSLVSINSYVDEMSSYIIFFYYFPVLDKRAFMPMQVSFLCQVMVRFGFTKRTAKYYRYDESMIKYR